MCVLPKLYSCVQNKLCKSSGLSAPPSTCSFEVEDFCIPSKTIVYCDFWTKQQTMLSALTYIPGLN